MYGPLSRIEVAVFRAIDPQRMANWLWRNGSHTATSITGANIIKYVGVSMLAV